MVINSVHGLPLASATIFGFAFLCNRDTFVKIVRSYSLCMLNLYIFSSDSLHVGVYHRPPVAFGVLFSYHQVTANGDSLALGQIWKGVIFFKSTMPCSVSQQGITFPATFRFSSQLCYSTPDFVSYCAHLLFIVLNTSQWRF